MQGSENQQKLLFAFLYYLGKLDENSEASLSGKVQTCTEQSAKNSGTRILNKEKRLGKMRAEKHNKSKRGNKEEAWRRS